MGPDAAWPKVPLASLLAEMRNGSTATQTKSLQGLPVTRIETIADGKIDFSRVGYVDATAAEMEPYRLQPGDVLLSHINSVRHIGKVAIYRGESPLYHGMNLMLLRWNRDKVEHAFGYQLLVSHEAKRYFEMRCKKAVNQASLNRADIGDLVVALPPLPEQRKIAAILSAVDEVIEKTEAVIESLQALKKAMMQELLTRGLPGRHTRFKQTEIGEVPEGWEVARVGEVCELRNNLRKPIEVSERERMPGPYPYYGPTKVLSHINEYRVEGMHALIGEDGDHFLKYDKWPMTQLLSGRFNVNNHAHVVRGSERCATEWFFLFFKHRDIVQHLTRQGAGRYKLRKATLMDLLVALPPVDEQLAIFRTLRTVEQYVEGEVEQKTAATKLKSALMSVLLTGELRVTPDKDVA